MNKKTGRVLESHAASLDDVKFKVSRTLELVRKHAKICVLALLASNSTAIADNSAMNEGVVLAHTASSETTDTKGVIDYSSLSATEIQEHILEVQSKIDELKNGNGSLSRQQKFELIAYQDELKTLRDYEQHIQKEAIDNYDAALKNFEEIKGFLSSDIIHAYPEFGDIIENGQDLLDNGNSETLTSEQVEEVTKQALAYLKNNEAVLSEIYFNLEKSGKGAEFKTYLITQDADFAPIFDKIDSQKFAVDIALEDGKITKANWNILHGENDERLDISGDTPVLKLEGKDGLLLEVGEIDAPQTEIAEAQLSDMRAQLTANEQMIAQYENRLGRYDDMLADFASYEATDFNNAETRSNFTAQLLAANPELNILEPDILFIETGREFATFLVNHISELKTETQRDADFLKAETVTLERDIGILAQKVESQKRLAQEKIRVQKERVRASARFIEATGASALVQKLQGVFTCINEANPVMLENGDIITDFDPARMEFTGSFSPSLGNLGAEDFRTQETFIALINKVLGDVTITLGASGLPVFRMSGEIVDRAKFDAYVAGVIGGLGFETRVVQVVFGNRQES